MAVFPAQAADPAAAPFAATEAADPAAGAPQQPTPHVAQRPAASTAQAPDPARPRVGPTALPTPRSSEEAFQQPFRVEHACVSRSDPDNAAEAASLRQARIALQTILAPGTG
jgi:hypothetical protein